MFDKLSAEKKSSSVPLFERGIDGQACRLLHEMIARQEFFHSLKKRG